MHKCQRYTHISTATFCYDISLKHHFFSAYVSRIAIVRIMFSSCHGRHSSSHVFCSYEASTTNYKALWNAPKTNRSKWTAPNTFALKLYRGVLKWYWWETESKSTNTMLQNALWLTPTHQQFVSACIAFIDWQQHQLTPLCHPSECNWIVKDALTVWLSNATNSFLAKLTILRAHTRTNIFVDLHGCK